MTENKNSAKTPEVMIPTRIPDQSAPTSALPAGTSVETTATGQIVERKTELASDAIAAAAKARVEARFVLALRQPRDEDLARVKILNRCKDPAFADRAIYKRPQGGKDIAGLSIRFAEEALRLWRNVDSRVQVIFEDEKQRIVNVSVTDLEANVAYDRDLCLQKVVERRNPKDREVVGERKNSAGEKVYLVRATEDELSVKEANFVSKLIRNNGLRFLPADVKEDAYDLCIETIKNGVNKDPEAARRKIVSAFAELNVRPADLIKYLGHPIEQSSADEIASLRAIRQAMVDDGRSWSQVMQDRDGGGMGDDSAGNGKSTIAPPKEKSAPTPAPSK